jgi:chemotaxis methyl-accepting protein methylase
VNPSVARVARIVADHTGIVVSGTHATALASAIERAGGGADTDAFADMLLHERSGRETLARLLDEYTVKETSFFRDREQFEAIDWQALLAAAQRDGRDTVRVWSAACSTGEEAYTLAALAAESLGSPGAVCVFGTDVSSDAVRRAEEARYGHRVRRDLDEAARDRYFVRDGTSFVVRDELRRRVRFSQHNLVHDAAAPPGHGPFDLIVCRNVLIYFAPATSAAVVATLARALAPRGRLLLGAADALCVITPRLADVASTLAAKPRAPRRRPPVAAASVPGAGDARADYAAGIQALERGDAPGAIHSLRRALYFDPAFGVAAFALGCAHDANGKPAAALRAYEQALRTLVGAPDLVAVCQTRAAALRGAEIRPGRTEETNVSA